MSTLVAAVRARISAECSRESCRKAGCRASLPGSMRPFVLIDLDDPASPTGGTGNRCDYLFIGSDRNLVAPLELKEGSPRASTVVKQLRAGARIADRLIPTAGTRIDFRPVIISDGMSKRERVEFAKSKNRIRFRGKSSFVALHKCGKPLDQVNW